MFYTIERCTMSSHFSTVFVVFSLLVSAVQGTTYDSHLTIPLHFLYNQGGTPPSSAESDWVLLPSAPPLEYRFSGSISDLPFTFDFGANLHIDYNEDDFWIPEAGTRFVSAQAWISSYDQSECNELTSDLGFSFGVSLRPPFIKWPVVSFGKDFQVNIAGNGELPLGDNNMVGGMDFIDLASIPLDKLAPGGKVVQGSISTFFDTLETQGVSAFSISLMGEMVMHGNSVHCTIGGEDIAFTGIGISNAVPVTIEIPHDLEQNIVEIDPSPDFRYDLYMGYGEAITIVDPLIFSFRPSLVERGISCSWLPYDPPSLLTLETSYDKVIENASVLSDIRHYLIFHMKTDPKLPDMSIDWIAVNPAENGNAFADETTRIDITVGNWGRRDSVTNSWMKLHLWIESGSTTNYLYHWLNFDQQSIFRVFGKDETAIYSFYTSIPAGKATLKAEVRYYEVENSYWKYDAMQYDTVYADENIRNNTMQRGVHVYPERGMIIGDMRTNPDPSVLPIENILIEVQHVNGSTTTVTDASGCFEFGSMPEGQCRIHVLPEKPADPDRDPWWVPKSYCYYHYGNTVDKFDDYSQSEFDVTFYQFQKISGTICDKGESPVAEAIVTVGNPSMLSAETDRDGEYTIDGVPPRGAFTLNVYHQRYETLHGEFDTYYVDNSFIRSQNLKNVVLSADTNCPTMNITLADEVGIIGSNFDYILETYDFDKPTEQMQWEVWDKGQGKVETSSGWLDLCNTNGYYTIVTGTVDIATLSDGDYFLNVKVRDVTGNQTVSTMLPFKVDTTAPSPALSIDDGAAVTSDDIVKLTLTLGGNEPGPLYVKFSNDMSEWSDPINWFPESPLIIDTWKLSGEGYEELIGLATVYVYVSDTLEHTTLTSDDIAVNAIGALNLAGGAIFWPSNTIPFTLSLPFGQISQLWSEPDPFDQGNLLDLGNQIQYAAQKIVLSSPITVTYAKLKFPTYSPPFAGNPNDLHIRLVSQLDPVDPTCEAYKLVEWSGSPTEATNTPAYFDSPVTISNTVYMLVYSLGGDLSNFYRLCLGTVDISYGGKGYPAYQYTTQPSSGWEVIPPLLEPYPSTLVLDLGYQDNGVVQIAGDGTCDTEPWHVYPDGLPAEVTVPTDGVRTVTVRRKFADNTTGDYAAAIVVDTLPPTGSVTINSIDTFNRLIYATCQANESGSGVSTMSYKTSFGWKTLPYNENLTIRYYDIAFDALQVYYTDRAGNSGPVCQAPITQDIFPPQLDAWFNAGSLCTDHGENDLHLDAQDTTSPIRDLRWDEEVSGTTSGWIAFNDTIRVDIPFYLINEHQVCNDGEYRFWIQVRDAAGNCSSRILRKLTLDREDPDIKYFYLRGVNAPGYTDDEFFYMNFNVWDAVPYPLMEKRYRINNGSWSGWKKIYRKPYQLLVDCSAYSGMSFSVDLQVRDEAGNTVTSSSSIPFKRPPDQPSGITPNDICYYRSQVLTATAFSDPDFYDYMRYSWWRVRNTDGYVVYDSGPLGTGTQFLLKTPLEYNQTYKWEVLYSDKDWLSSPWSEGVEFSIDSLDLDGDGMPDGWETQEFSNTLHEAKQDFDGDGLLNGEEFEAGTSAADSNSVLRITGLDCIGESQHQINFSSVPGAVYALDFCTNLIGNAWTEQVIHAAAFPGGSTTIGYTANSNGMYNGFYRIRLHQGP